MAFQFNPGKSVRPADEPPVTNGEQAEQALEIVRMDPNWQPGDEMEGSMINSIVGLFHLCDRERIDVEELLSNAKMHWQRER